MARAITKDPGYTGVKNISNFDEILNIPSQLLQKNFKTKVWKTKDSG